jgi:predicted Fe-S protein YdhL (DUF1289 family)
MCKTPLFHDLSQSKIWTFTESIASVTYTSRFKGIAMTRPNIESPCIKVCAVDGQSGLCLGCGRSLKEIGGWMHLGDEGRRDVMEVLPERMKHLRDIGKLEPQA